MVYLSAATPSIRDLAGQTRRLFASFADPSFGSMTLLEDPLAGGPVGPAPKGRFADQAPAGEETAAEDSDDHLMLHATSSP